MIKSDSISVMSQILSDAEMRQCIDVSEELISVSSKSDFNELVSRQVRQLIPHECSVCVFIDKDTYAVTNMHNVDYPEGFLNDIMHDKNSNRVVESPLVKSWLRGSKVIMVDDSLYYNPRYEQWTAAAQRYNLKNMLVNGLEVQGQRRFSYFNFTNHLRPVTDKEQRILSLLTPHMHLALARVEMSEETKPTAAQKNSDSSRFGLLSNREFEVLKLVEKGLKNAEIAELLFISPFTIKNHVRHIYEKLGVKNRVEAVTLYRDCVHHLDRAQASPASQLL